MSEEGKKGTEELKASEQRRDGDPRLGPDLCFTPLKMQAAGVQAAARPALHCTVSDLLICIAIDRASEMDLPTHLRAAAAGELAVNALGGSGESQNET